MRALYIFVTIFVALPAFVKASCFSEQNDEVFVQSLSGSHAIFEYRVKLFSAFFGESVFGEDGLFVFYEKNGLQRLFVFDQNQNSVKTYQLPRLKMSPWLNPEMYIEKRNTVLARKERAESCRQTIFLDSATHANLWQLRMEKHAFLSNRCITQKNLDPRQFNHVIMGFMQQHGSRKPFYFIKFENYEKKMPEMFEAYTKSFDMIENLDDKIVFEGCQ